MGLIPNDSRQLLPVDKGRHTLNTNSRVTAAGISRFLHFSPVTLSAGLIRRQRRGSRDQAAAFNALLEWSEAASCSYALTV